MQKISVTGLIASGKSSVCQIFEKKGAVVLSADVIVHELLVPSSPIGNWVVELLGEDIINGNELDRKRIAQKVFNNLALLTALEQHLHPLVRMRLNQKAASLMKEKYPPLFFVAEVPLLFECGWEKDYDVTMAVIANENDCIKRFGDAIEYHRRASRHFSAKEKADRATYTIHNNGDLALLETQVQTIITKLGE